MGRACSKYGIKGVRTGVWRESQDAGGHCEDIDTGGKIILKEMLEKWDDVILIDIIWPRIEISGLL
jgi:hypothetical protein